MKSSGNIFFYAIILYILAAGSWWSYLLHSKNSEIKKVQLEKIKLEYASGDLSIEKTEAYQQILNRYDRQRWMINGEAAVFMLILLFGLWRIYRIRQKELALALQQQNFLLSITHELKSPLASIQLVLETIHKRTLTEEQLKKLSNNGLKENDRLHRLVQDLLLAARVEGGYQYSFDKVDLKSLLLDTLDSVKAKYKGKIIFNCANDEVILLKAEYSTLTTAFSNLLENAIKYSSDSGNINVNLFQKNDNITIEIADEGIGIPKSEREKIFNKFYRIGNEYTRNTKGTGLGLYIVKKVIQAHGGNISVKDNQPKGTVFSVTF